MFNMWLCGIFAFALLVCVSGEYAVTPIDCDENLNDYDRAKLMFSFSSTAPGDFTLFAVNEDCYRCAWTFLANATSGCVSVWTPFPWKVYLARFNESTQFENTYYRDLPSLASTIETFGDQGVYQFNVDGVSTSVRDSGWFTVEELHSPTQVYTPLLALFGVLTAMAIVAFSYEPLLLYWRERTSGKDFPDDAKRDTTTPLLEEQHTVSAATESTPQNSTNTATAPKKTKPARLHSLDTFRGISLVLMIFVNYGGGGYWFFEHAAWNGLTVADLLFPWFMWIMGVSMALSFSNILPVKPHQADSSLPAQYDEALLAYNATVRDVWGKVLLRAAKLFLIGMFIANGYEYTTWRIPGVLQYFAVSYFVTAATILVCYPRTQRLLEEETARQRETDVERAPQNDENEPIWSAKRAWAYMMNLPQNISLCACYRYELVIQTAILFIYLCIVLGAAAPGCPRGYNGAGGLSDNADHFSCVGGIHRYVDMKVFGYDLVYHHATCRELYRCPAYDPEGLLGSLSACTLTYLGLLAGRVFLHVNRAQDRVQSLLLGGGALLLLGGALCGFSQNDGAIPVNKNLWSTSFVCVCAGGALLGLSLCFVCIDVLRVWTGAPWSYLGMNSILIYVFHQLLANYMPFSYMLYHVNHGSLLLCHAVGVSAWVLIAWYFHRIRFFVKV